REQPSAQPPTLHPHHGRPPPRRDRVRGAIPNDADASPALRAERASRRGACVPVGMGPRDAGVLDDTGPRSPDVLGPGCVHLRGPDRATCASSWAATNDRARAAVRLHPWRPRRDPPRRRDHSHRTPAHGGAGRLGGDLLLRLPTRVARGSPPIQRGRRLMVRYVRLLQLFFRTELQYELEYRLNLVLEII